MHDEVTAVDPKAMIGPRVAHVLRPIWVYFGPLKVVGIIFGAADVGRVRRYGLRRTVGNRGFRLRRKA
ncbi:hypothetical protein Prum_010100 [Phytohabitans rumicis]|uniref:Uncharacterized protein n=1 Tax=Phytohabitans rumicis TaxID=1076125 RepID=A0A6V8KXG5_9ACTN|nr:hypothetical protein Prum_010100 [Phytohabitans rumicis]